MRKTKQMNMLGLNVGRNQNLGENSLASWPKMESPSSLLSEHHGGEALLLDSEGPDFGS